MSETMEQGQSLRVPPRSKEAEQALLGGLLLDNRAFGAVAGIVRAEDFFESEHAAIWAAIDSLCAARRPADVITVWDRIVEMRKGGLTSLDYLSALAVSVPSASAAKRYAEIVRERSLQRRLIAAAQDIDGIVWGDGTASEKADKAAQLLAALERGTRTKDPRMLIDILPSRLKHLEDLESGQAVSGIPTGIADLDRHLSGGLKPGHVYVLAARPSVGKSSFAQAIGLNVAESGKRVLMLSQEMPEAEVADRALSNLSRVSYESIQLGQLEAGGHSRLIEGVTRGQDLPFAVDDQPALKLSDIRNKARWMRGCDLLIVDYVQLCASDESKDNRQAEVEQISRGLKALGKELGLSVLVLSQLNRKVEERPTKEPILSDLRDSGAIEQDADAVIFLWPVRDFDAKSRLIGCKLEKNRQGRKGRFGLHFDGDMQRWGGSTESIDPKQEQPTPPRKRVQ